VYIKGFGFNHKIVLLAAYLPNHSRGKQMRMAKNAMKKAILRFWKEQTGQDLVEYALLLLLVAFAVAATVRSTGNAAKIIFASAATRVGVTANSNNGNNSNSNTNNNINDNNNSNNNGNGFGGVNGFNSLANNNNNNGNGFNDNGSNNNGNNNGNRGGNNRGD